MNRYDIASAVAAEICNLHLRSDRPTHESFGMILFLILDALDSAEQDIPQPSDN